MRGGLTEKGAQKWPKHAALILFRQRNNTLVKIDWTVTQIFGCAASD